MFMESATTTFFVKLETDVLSYQVSVVKMKVGDTEIWDYQTKLSMYSPDGESFSIKSRAAPQEGFPIS
ncbi:MAG: hypothetical protein HYY37_00235 [Candidatus Aenigmarchaeota archaeon]|nr:hypothetical protein [Candidatus Aenigmarchaeota archaeon]